MAADFHPEAAPHTARFHNYTLDSTAGYNVVGGSHPFGRIITAGLKAHETLLRESSATVTWLDSLLAFIRYRIPLYILFHGICNPSRL